MIPRIFGEDVIGRAGPVPVTATMTTTAVVSLALVAAGSVLARAAWVRPESRTASVARVAHGALERTVFDASGTRDSAVTGIALALFAFIACSAALGQLPGVQPPTANITTTSALAVVVFLAVPILGVARRGPVVYLREYFRPNPLFAPLHVVSELSRTLALALRLFGNMMSGHLVVALLVALAGLVVPVPLMALDLLIGVLQGYVFMILACVYLGAALGAGEST
jgi:F-type H+-transporting ATPase subunit a